MDKSVPSGMLARGKVVGKTLVKIGVNHSKGAIKKLVAHNSNKSAIQKETEETTAKLIIEALGELRGVSVKIAQQVALALPFLPKSYLDEIGKSFNAVPPINRALIRKIIKQELGEYPETIFDSFESTPFGSASLGQVHKAVFEGKQIALKVQYPGIANTISTDIGMIKFALERFAKGKNIDHIVDEINKRLGEEVDYVYEANSLSFFREHISNPYIVIPQYYPELSTSKVLACSFIDGQGFFDFLKSSPSQELKNHYAQLMFDTFFDALYRLKAIHADPNPGNFIFGQNKELGIVDFGCIKYVDDAFLSAYNGLHLSLIEGRDDLYVARQYVALNMIDDGDDDSVVAFYTEIIKPLDRIYIEILQDDYYDFGAEYQFSKKGFETVLSTQKKQTHSVHKYNQEYLFLNRTLLGYYSVFEQMNAKIDTKFAKKLMSDYKGEYRG